MRKPIFCICENKDADQLRGDREADQRLCFRIKDSSITLLINTKFQTSSHLLFSVFSRRGRNRFFAYAKTKTQISFAVTAKLISAFVFESKIVQSLYLLIRNFKPLAIFCGCTAWFVSDLVENSEVRFSHNATQTIFS